MQAPVSLEYAPTAVPCVSTMAMTSKDHSISSSIGEDHGTLHLTDETEADDSYNTSVLTIVTHDSKDVLRQELDNITGMAEGTRDGISIVDSYSNTTCPLTIVRTEESSCKTDQEDEFQAQQLAVHELDSQATELSEKSLAESVSAVNLKQESADDGTGELVLKGPQFQLVGLTPKGKKQYRCCLCNTLCIDPAVHKLVHSEMKPFECNAIGCGKSYKSKAALKHHFLSNHAITVPHKCLKCGKVFRTEYLLKKHMTVTCNDSKPYICQTCGKPFKTLPKLKYHEGIHAQVKLFKCEICGKGMASKAHLKVHLIVHEEGNYNCFCGKHFKSVKRYREHYKLIHDPNNPFKCNICGKNYKNEAILEHHKLSHNRPYACRFCKKGFVQLLSCKLHERSQHKQAEQNVPDLTGDVCPVCNKRYKNNKAMLVHFTVHSLDDKFECPHCDKKFKLEKHLQSHLVVHAERSLPCPKCDKMFKHEKNLKIHMNSHEKPFECNECGSRFAHERYLLHHLEKHKEGITPKIYRCPHCGKSYPSLSNAKLHIEEEHPNEPKLSIMPQTPLALLRAPKTRCTWRKYDGSSPIKKNTTSRLQKTKKGHYNCDLCSDVFTQESQLLSHELKKHTSSKLSCPKCEVKFTTNRTLAKHQYVVHDINNKMVCYQCERDFYDERDLERHVLIVHNCQQTGNDDSEALDKIVVSVCIICAKHFQSQELLDDHEKCHRTSEMVCNICGLGFHSVDILKVHVDACSEKQCVFCLQSFESARDLEKHKRFHQLGRVTIKCSVCSEEFMNNRDLGEHRKTHEKVKGTSEKATGFKSLLSAFTK